MWKTNALWIEWYGSWFFCFTVTLSIFTLRMPNSVIAGFHSSFVYLLPLGNESYKCMYFHSLLKKVKENILIHTYVWLLFLSCSDPVLVPNNFHSSLDWKKTGGGSIPPFNWSLIAKPHTALVNVSNITDLGNQPQNNKICMAVTLV